MNIDQSIVNWVFTGAGSILGLGITLLLSEFREIRQFQRDREQFEREITARVSQVELLVAGDYVKKDEFVRVGDAIFRKLDSIADKLDKKQDKV